MGLFTLVIRYLGIPILTTCTIAWQFDLKPTITSYRNIYLLFFRFDKTSYFFCLSSIKTEDFEFQRLVTCLLSFWLHNVQRTAGIITVIISWKVNMKINYFFDKYLPIPVDSSSAVGTPLNVNMICVYSSAGKRFVVRPRG